MSNVKSTKKSQLSVHNVLFWAVGSLFILTMLSTWIVSGTFAKYVKSASTSDSARVAAGGYVELWEHEAELNNGEYKLKLNENGKASKNTYAKVIPGVDIPKDPFVRLKLKDAEVDYKLYITVTEKNFPTYKPTPKSDPVKTVTYSVITKEIAEQEGIDYYWILQEDLSDEDNGVYVYKFKDILDAGTTVDRDIKILKNDKLYVSEHYVGFDDNGKAIEFALTFNAWLEQVD